MMNSGIEKGGRELEKTIKLFSKICNVLAPPPKLTIDEWADQKRILSSKTSAEPGRWNTDRVPFQREVMRAISDPRTEMVVLMYAAQLSKTETLLNVFGYYADYEPAPIMFLMPTQKAAEDFATTRLNDMVKSTPELKTKIIVSEDGRNTKTQKEFAGGYIVLTGSESPTELASRPIRVLLSDEIDRYKSDVKGEGDPLNLAIERTKTFWNRKIVVTSTPTISGESRIEAEYNSSSMEEYYIPCPKCKTLQKLEWRNIVFDPIGHKCDKCSEISTENQWKKEMKNGAWIASAELEKEEKYRKRGFKISELYSPFSKWKTIIQKFKDAKGDMQKMKVFTNTCLGEAWEDFAEKVDFEELSDRRELYGCEIPEKVKALTAGVDIQADRIEVEVVGWGEGEESWGIEYKALHGDPTENDVWDQLDRLLDKEYSYKSGERIKVLCTCIDTGYKTNEVYQYLKPREHRRIFGIKGLGGDGKALLSNVSRTNRAGVALFTLGVNTGKETLVSRMKIKEEGPRFMHYPIEEDRGYDETYFKGLTSEKRVTTWKKGIKKVEWKLEGTQRNEPVDLRNYAYAALKISNPDLTKRYIVQNKTKVKRRIKSKGVVI